MSLRLGGAAHVDAVAQSVHEDALLRPRHAERRDCFILFARTPLGNVQQANSLCEALTCAFTPSIALLPVSNEQCPPSETDAARLYSQTHRRGACATSIQNTQRANAGGHAADEVRRFVCEPRTRIVTTLIQTPLSVSEGRDVS